MSTTFHVLLLIATLMLAAATIASAEETALPVDGGVYVTAPDALPEWNQMTIRGDAAAALFGMLPASSEQTYSRNDGTTYRARVVQSFACVISELFIRPQYACGMFLSKSGDGTTLPAVIDPVIGGVARIGVSN